MEEFKREFRGVFISCDVWLDERLNMLEKGILTEIDSLDNEDTGCFASNEYLAKFCQCSVTKVSSAIKKLIDLEYVYVKSFDGRVRVLKSRLTKNVRQTYRKCKADLQNLKEINIDNNIDNKDNIYINCEHSTTSGVENDTTRDCENDTTINKNNNKKEDKNNNNYKYIVDFLNGKAGTNYKHTTGKTQSLIKARINEGFTLDDFKQVITNKCNAWLHTDWEKYLRPETLFGTKFESYLNEKEKGIAKEDNPFARFGTIL